MSAVLACFLALGLTGCGVNSRTSSAQTPSTPDGSTVGLIERHVQFQQVDYPFWIFLPPAYDGTQVLPAILLVHGAGGNGPDFLNIWRNFAGKNGIILVAPTVPDGTNFEINVVPELYPMIMDAARSEWKIDPRRIYLFGFSAGGYTVFDAGLPDSQYFAAGGVFAAIITPDFDSCARPDERYPSQSISVITMSSSLWHKRKGQSMSCRPAVLPCTIWLFPTWITTTAPLLPR